MTTEWEGKVRKWGTQSLKKCQMSSVFFKMSVLLDLKTIWKVFLVAGQGGEC